MEMAIHCNMTMMIALYTGDWLICWSPASSSQPQSGWKQDEYTGSVIRIAIHYILTLHCNDIENKTNTLALWNTLQQLCYAMTAAVSHKLSAIKWSSIFTIFVTIQLHQLYGQGHCFHICGCSTNNVWAHEIRWRQILFDQDCLY